MCLRAIPARHLLRRSMDEERYSEDGWRQEDKKAEADQQDRNGAAGQGIREQISHSRFTAGTNR